MTVIVGVRAHSLNAHSCRCLACFSMHLEKKHKTLHTVLVKMSCRSSEK
ncbi:hypothetical protein SAMN04487787_10161 [Kosakonia sacchari]|nr:hypothetical protein SAMN04487787_10161 [Kosakonia sacchari]